MKNLKEKPPIEDDTSHFPCDITQNILSKLPVKSLLRFKSVCKSWKATIDDPGFTKIHSNQVIISDSQCFYAATCDSYGAYNLITFQGQKFNEKPVLGRYPWEGSYCSPLFLCCCEGILLFRKYHYKVTRQVEYALWNPFTGNYSTFPCPHDDIDHYGVGYGLCFDKYEDYYKFIIVLESKYLVYSIKNHSWDVRRSEFRKKVHSPGPYADGVVYWIMSLGVGEPCCNTIIIYFDPKDNLLKELPKPRELEHDDRSFLLTNLGGNLCFYTSEEEIIEIWLLKECSGQKCWMKLATADNRESPAACESYPYFYDPTPMYLTSNDKVVFHDPKRKCYAVYCLKKQEFGIAEYFPACSYMIEFTCMESLNFPATRRE